MTVYVHINKVNNKRYYGITSQDVNVRWKNGFGYAKHLPIRRAFDKYGWDNFEHIVLYDNLSDEDAKAIEQNLIAKYKTQDDRYGYNITSGGDGVKGWHPSEETKAKISESAKKRTGEKNPNYNHKWTDQMKSENAIKHKRENLSQETIKKMSENAQNRVGKRNPFFGKTHSQETKDKIAKCRYRAVIMFDLDGRQLNEFESIKDASKTTGVNKVAISNCCRNLTKTSGGYIWKYKDSL